MIVMIAIHTLAYFLSNRFYHSLWNYSNFVVQMFLFSSAYLFFIRESSGKFSYIVKRVWRLIAPYYLFLLAYFGLLLAFEPKKITAPFIVKNLLLVGGVDINWLVILFLYMAVLMPLIGILTTKNKWLVHLIFFISVISATVLLFIKSPLPYKILMWLPWLTIPMITYYFTRAEKNKSTPFIMTFLSFLIFLGTAKVIALRQTSPIFFNNKYPPNIYFLSYGVAWIGVLLVLFQSIKNQKRITDIFNFFSKYSYSLFFIHYLVIYLVSKTIPYTKLGWPFFFLLVLFSSVIVQLLLNIAYRKRATLQAK